MAEEDAQVGADIAVNAQQYQPDTGGCGERIIKQQKQYNNNNNNKISQPVTMPRKSETKFIMGSSNYETDLLLSNKKKKQHQQRIVKDVQNIASDSEEGFLSTSPDSANGMEVMDITGNNVNGKIILQHIKSCDGDLENLTNNKIKNLTTTTTTTNKIKQSTIINTTTTTLGEATTTSDNNNNNYNSEKATQPPLYLCTNPGQCVTLKNILDSFKAPLSEEQAWALIYQFMSLYRCVAEASVTSTGERHIFNELEFPDTLQNLNLHRDGTVHCSWSEAELKKKEQKIQQQQQHQQQSQCDEQEERGDEISALLLSTQKKILQQIAVIVYTALDYNLQAEEQCQMSQELEELITYMTADENEDDCIDEGIDEGCRRWEDEHDDDKKRCETKEFDYVLEVCRNHIKPTAAEEHYRAVCRALFTETIELGIFLQQVLNDGAHNLHLKADSQTSKQELAKLGFHDWARFWVQVIDELRRGVRLKKNTYERAPIEYELTPYEILMEDIRSKKYQLRKVMVNGDIPPRVKKDAHAMILEFIRSRPPLKKASERQLPPPINRTPSPREQLMDSIRKGRQLKHIQPPITPRLKDRLLPPTSHNPMITSSPSLSTTLNTTPSAMNSSAITTKATTPTNNVSNNALDSLKLEENMEPHTTPRSQQRLIKVDFALLQDDDNFFVDDKSSSSLASTSACSKKSVCSQPKMPPYPIGGYMVSNVASVTSTNASSGNNQANCANKMLTTSISTAPQVPPALTTRALRRTNDPYSQDEYHQFFDNALESYDLATQCESRRVSLRRHTIVGCQSNFDETHSMPTSRPDSRQSDLNANGVVVKKQLVNSLNQPKYQARRSESPAMSSSSNNSKTCSRSSSSVGPWNKSFLDEKTWQERGDDRLSLTLEEIVHIRSVMTKAELEGLPVGVRVKEDVEKRKICFLCLRTRFSIFGPWGIICKLCQRTVCSKCYTKMRIPSEHFRKVPLVLISPSLLSSPAGSSTPSPSHYAQHAHSSSTGNMLDENFPKSLIERLLRSESERKARSSVGSAPSSPKHQRSNMSTPGLAAVVPPNPAVEALHDAANYTNSVRNQHTKPITQIDLMSRSMEGPRSLPVHSPARPYSNSSTLDRKSRFSRAFTLSSSGLHLSGPEQKENVRGEQVPVCNDCRGLVMEITSSSKHTRSSARNRALKNLTLDLSPVYK